MEGLSPSSPPLPSLSLMTGVPLYLHLLPKTYEARTGGRGELPVVLPRRVEWWPSFG